MDINRLCEITRCNLDLYTEQKNRIASGEKAHISQLCRYFCRADFTDDDPARRLYTELTEKLSATDEERNIFCRLLYDTAKEENCNFFESVLSLKKPGKTATVSYMRNPLSDKAYDKFSRHFNSLSASYEASFSDCAQKLYIGECDYVILPISDSNGRLLRFYSLIDRYELRFALCCRVTDEVNDSENLFALLCRDIVHFDCKGKTFLDLLLCDAKSDFVRLIDFSASLGIEPVVIDTMGTSFEDAKLHIVFDITDKSIYPLIAYTFLETPRHIIQGIYKEI